MKVKPMVEAEIWKFVGKNFSINRLGSSLVGRLWTVGSTCVPKFGRFNQRDWFGVFALFAAGALSCSTYQPSIYSFKTLSTMNEDHEILKSR